MAKMIHEKLSETRIVENVLAEAAIGQIVSYEQLSRAIGSLILKRRYIIDSAKGSLLKTNKMVFGCVRGVGLRRLNDEQVIDSIDCDNARVGKIARKSISKLATVNFSSLPEDAKRKHVVVSAQVGAIRMFTTPKARNLIESRVIADSGRTLSIGDTLSLFDG